MHMYVATTTSRQFHYISLPQFTSCNFWTWTDYSSIDLEETLALQSHPAVGSGHSVVHFRTNMLIQPSLFWPGTLCFGNLSQDDAFRLNKTFKWDIFFYSHGFICKRIGHSTNLDDHSINIHRISLEGFPPSNNTRTNSWHECNCTCPWKVPMDKTALRTGSSLKMWTCTLLLAVDSPRRECPWYRLSLSFPWFSQLRVPVLVWGSGTPRGVEEFELILCAQESICN